jgi:TetR/AcrR family transcriptional repressor of nem operon
VWSPVPLRGGRTWYFEKRIMTARPQTAPAATRSTRDHLIDVGLEIMRKHGYGASGVQAILDAAGVPKGSFYHHFTSKEAFTAAVVERYVALEAEHCREVLGNTRQAPLKRLRRYFEDLVRSAGQSAPIQGCLMGSLSLEIAGESALLQSCLSSNFSGWQAAVASVLREAIEKGDLPKSTRPETLAGFVLNSWEGALLRSQADRSDAPLRDFLHYIFDEFLVKSF